MNQHASHMTSSQWQGRACWGPVYMATFSKFIAKQFCLHAGDDISKIIWDRDVVRMPSQQVAVMNMLNTFVIGTLMKPTHGLRLLAQTELLSCSGIVCAQHFWKHSTLRLHDNGCGGVSETLHSSLFSYHSVFRRFHVNTQSKQKFCIFTCANGAWRPIPGPTSFHFLFQMCWNEGRVENVHCDTETWRMWESQSSRSKHFSPTLFSSTEVKVFCILMRISDAQRSHPESFTIRHEDICLSGSSYLFRIPWPTAVFVILPTFSLSAHLCSQQLICLLWQTTKTIHSSQLFRHLCSCSPWK